MYLVYLWLPLMKLDHNQWYCLEELLITYYVNYIVYLSVITAVVTVLLTHKVVSMEPFMLQSICLNALMFVQLNTYVNLPVFFSQKKFVGYILYIYTS